MMDFYLYDYDAQFRRDLQQWMRKHRGDYANMDEMEQAMPDMYAEWLETPAKWMNGEKPGHYFENFTDGETLIRGMLRYLVSGLGMPEPLMDRIVDLSEETEDRLLSILNGETVLPDKADAGEARMLCIHLLSEMGSVKAKDVYLDLVLSAQEEENEAADAAAQALQRMASDVKDELLAAFEDANPHARLLLCMALSEEAGDDRIAEKIRDLFRDPEVDVAVSAGLVGHYALDDMLPELERATKRRDINYMQYLELCHAIEELGGEVRHERDFSGDPDYEALKGIE